MSNEIIQTIGRLRRSQGRNQDTMQLCDAYEELWKQFKTVANDKMKQVEIVDRSECPDCQKRKAQGRDRIRAFRKRQLKGL